MLPGELFGTLWQDVVPFQHDVRITPWHGRRATEFRALRDEILAESTADIPRSVEEYLAGRDPGFACEVTQGPQRAFVVMCALDEAAMYIHPAMRTRTPTRSTTLAGILTRMKQDRTAEGHYGKIGNVGFVLPKGHLVSTKPRTDFNEASGADLAHQFSYLSFVPAPSAGQTLKPIVVPPSKLAVDARRANLVGMAPIAEDGGDLSFSVSTRLSHPFLDANPLESPLSARICDTTEAMIDRGAGLIVLPELVTSASAVTQLSDKLRLKGRTDGSLIVAGTGPSAASSPTNNRPYNEAVVMTASGEELYRQRKLNPFNMAADRMGQCQIDRAAGHEDKNHLEDCAMGTELVVCDIIGLGRVIVLICEDIEQEHPGGTVCSRTFPDWIVTPILDVKLEFGRWTHRRAIEIARKTLSRVVVSCSATLTVRKEGYGTLQSAPLDAIATGLCFDGMEELKGRFVKVGGTVTGRCDVVEWSAASWLAPWILPAPTTPAA